MEEILIADFFVEGEPRPKQSFRVSGKGGGYQPAPVKAWQTYVAIEAEQCMRSLGRFNDPYKTGRIKVSLCFNLGNNRRVDLDNLSKCVLDGLNGIVIGDDQQIYELSLVKNVDKSNCTGVQVSVFKLGE